MDCQNIMKTTSFVEYKFVSNGFGKDVTYGGQFNSTDPITGISVSASLNNATM
jgi:hypothetical protein